MYESSQRYSHYAKQSTSTSSESQDENSPLQSEIEMKIKTFNKSLSFDLPEYDSNDLDFINSPVDFINSLDDESISFELDAPFTSPSVKKFEIAQLESDKEHLLDKLNMLNSQNAEVERVSREKSKEIQRLEEIVVKLESANKALIDRMNTSSDRSSLIGSIDKSKSDFLLQQAVEIINRLRSEIEASKNESLISDYDQFLSDTSVLWTPEPTPTTNSNCNICFCL